MSDIPCRYVVTMFTLQEIKFYEIWCNGLERVMEKEHVNTCRGRFKMEEQKVQQKSTILKDAIALFVITLVAGALLGLVNQITKEPIEAAELKAKKEAYQKVFTEGSSFETDEGLNKKLADTVFDGSEISEILVTKDKDNNAVGYVMSLNAKEGYGGDITFTIGVKKDGTMTGLSVLSHSETAGLGANCTTESFQSQFEGVTGPEVVYSKTGKSADNEIDAISGATITTKALTKAVNAGLGFLNDNGYLEGIGK